MRYQDQHQTHNPPFSISLPKMAPFSVTYRKKGLHKTLNNLMMSYPLQTILLIMTLVYVIARFEWKKSVKIIGMVRNVSDGFSLENKS